MSGKFSEIADPFIGQADYITIKDVTCRETDRYSRNEELTKKLKHIEAKIENAKLQIQRLESARSRSGNT
jgi:hypothetical protein